MVESGFVHVIGELSREIKVRTKGRSLPGKGTSLVTLVNFCNNLVH